MLVRESERGEERKKERERLRERQRERGERRRLTPNMCLSPHQTHTYIYIVSVSLCMYIL